MGQHCGRCRFRDRGCTLLNIDDSKPRVEPHWHEECVFIKRGEASKFEPKPELGGIASYDTDPASQPSILKGAEGDESSHEGYAMVVRNGIKFMVRDGKAYSAGPGREYLGELSDMEPPKPSKEEVTEALRELRAKLYKEMENGR